MKKYIFFIIIAILLLPLCVSADDTSIVISDLTFVEKSNDAEIIEEASFNNLDLSFNIKLYNVGDYVKYSFYVENNSSKELLLDDDKLKMNNSYTSYHVDYGDNNDIVKPGEKKLLNLTISYDNPVDEKLFVSAKYDASNNAVLRVGEKGFFFVPNTFKDMNYIRIGIVLLIIIYALFYLFNIKKVKNIGIYIILLTFMIYPYIAKAYISFDIKINNKLIIARVKPDMCHYDGELFDGATFRLNGYIYRYKYRKNGQTSWRAMEDDGWGVALENPNSTDPVTGLVCSSINDKPIVATSFMYGYSQAEKIDLSSLDTSNVVNMTEMFYHSSASSLNLTSLDTSNVNSIAYFLSYNPNIEEADFSNFDLSNVKYDTLVYENAKLNTIITPKVNPLNGYLGPIFFDDDNNPYENLNDETPTRKKLTTRTIMKSGLTGLLNSLMDYKTIEGFIREYDSSKIESNKIDISIVGSRKPIYAWLVGNDVHYYSEDKYIYLYKYSSGLFSDMKKVKKIDLRGIKTDLVTGMSSMFSNNYALEELDLSGFNTSKVEYMESMFNNCSSLKKLDLSSFDTSNVRYMTYMFLGASKVEELDISSFNTSNVIDMSYMFRDMSSLKSLDVSNFDTSKVTTMQLTFAGLSSLKSLDVSMLDTSSVTNMYGMLAYNKSLTSLKFKGIDTSKVTDMRYMFSSDNSLEEIDITGLDTSNVTDMSNMFYYATGLKRVNMGNLNTSKVTNMSYMFAGCYELEAVNMNNIDTSNVTNMNSMFYYTFPLTDLNISSFDTSKVTDFSYMFYCNYLLRSLDLSGFNFNSATNYSSFFRELYSLTKILTPKTTQEKTISILKTFYDLDNNSYTNIDSSLPTNTLISVKEEAVFDTGSNVSDKMTFLSNAETHSSGYESIKHIKRAASLNDINIVLQSEHRCDNFIKMFLSTTTSPYPIIGWFDLDSSTLYYYSEIEKLYLNTNASQMFAYFSKVEDIDIKDFDSSRVTNLSDFFRYNRKLKKIDISHFDTSNVTTMSQLFDYNVSLEELNLSGVDTSKNTSFRYFFYGCEHLTSLDMSDMDMSKSTTEYYMFESTTRLRWLKTPKKYTSSSIALPRVFVDQNGREYTSINSSTPKQTLLKAKFKITFDANQGTVDVPYKYYDFETDHVFGDLPTPVREGYEFVGWYTSKTNGNKIVSTTPITDIKDYQLYAAWKQPDTYLIEAYSLNQKLKTIAGNVDVDSSTPDNNIKHFKRLTDSSLLPNNYDTDDNRISDNSSFYPVYAWFEEDTGTMYYYSESEKILLNESSSNMFSRFESLLDVDLTGFDTKNVTSFSNFFEHCYSLKTVDLSNFNFSSTHSLDSFFYNCKNLKTIIFGTMNYSNITGISSMFDGCESLEEIDMSSFHLGKINSANRLFNNCKSLKTVNISGLDLSGSEYFYEVFKNCTSLESIDLSNVNLSGVKTVWGVFENCEKLKSVDLSGFRNASLEQFTNIFAGCKSLTSVDLSMINFSSVTSAYGIFKDCTSLTEFSFEAFKYASNLKDISNFFNGCTSLVTVDLSDLNITSLNSLSAMFANCTSLKNVDLSHFNISNPSVYNMLLNCTSLEVVDLSGMSFTSSSSGVSAIVSSLTKLKQLKTYKSFTTVSYITLPKKMYAQGSSTGVTQWKKTDPPETLLKDQPWD